MKTYLIEQQAVLGAETHILPELYPADEAHKRAVSLGIGEHNWFYTFRQATADEIAQIESLIAASDAFHAQWLSQSHD